MCATSNRLSCIGGRHITYIATKVFPVIISLAFLLILKSSLHEDSPTLVASAFHLSFAHRLVKSIYTNTNREQLQQHQYSSTNPLLNPPENLIRPIECRNANNHSEAGICMFSIDCMQNKGVPLSICKHNYFVGTCCKLPDYNNFVGIVYDLRETETGQQQALEARRAAVAASSDALHIFKSPGQAQAESATSQASTTSTSASLDGSPSQPDAGGTMRPSVNKVDEASAMVAGRQQVGGSSTSASPINETNKYLISSTKLFPVASAPTTANRQVVAAAAAAQPVPAETAGETARQATDGSSPLQVASSQLAFGSITDDQLVQGLNATGPNSAYELLSPSAVSSTASSQATSQPPQQASASAQAAASAASQQTIVVSSAHSASTGQQQQQQQQTSPASVSSSLADDLTAEVASSAHNPRQPMPTTTAIESGSSIYQSSSHDEAATPTGVASSTSGYTPSDQEFTLSTGSVDRIPVSGWAQSRPPPSAVTGVDLQLESSQRPPDQPADASPLVTLISSPAASTETPGETTTPFTSSLSTAILPNISSHPYAPTTTTTSATTSSTTTTTTTTAAPSTSAGAQNLISSPQTPSSPPPPSQALVSPAITVSTTPDAATSTAIANDATPHSQSTPLAMATQTTAQETGASTGQPTIASGTSASPGVHYYSTASSGPSSLMAQATTHGHKPGSLASNLQMASKIVTGNSGANNLIPGLSGLQSAILAHIPFKIASGLSSGLSSYLQAAMKPPGQSSGRPLISSNTAPALQYQQQQQQQHHHHHQHDQQNQSTSARPVASSSAQPSAVRFPGTNSTPAGGGGGGGGGESTSSPSSPPNPVTSARDVAREAQLVCGRPRVSELNKAANKRVARIVGGNQSSFGQWPWMVSLRQWRKGAFLHKCGAALLNENWAITAAHCVENVKAPDLLLRLGEFDVSNQNEPYPYIERRVKTVVSHPSFDPKTFEYDLALIRFTEPIQYERNIIPVCVPQGNDSYVDRMATVIGWGRLFEDGPLPDVIQHVDVPIITNQECEKMYKSAGFVEEIPDMFICAGISKGGRDSCEGDSGGPLTMVDHDGRSYLVGIISWGIGCALPSQPGVYTRITAFSPWINQIIAN